MKKISLAVIMVFGLLFSPILAYKTQAANSDLMIISPNGGEVLTLNTPQTIVWNGSSTTSLFAANSVKIDLISFVPPCTTRCIERPQFMFTIVSDAPNTGSYNWIAGQAGKSLVPAGQYFMTVTKNEGNVVTDQSDGPFTLVDKSVTPANPSNPDGTIKPVPVPLPIICAHADGNIRYLGSATVYYLQNCKKQAYTSLNIFKLWGKPFSSVSVLSSSEVYPDNGYAHLPNNILVKGSGPTVYLTSDVGLKPFSSAASFTNRGYSFRNVALVSDGDLGIHMMAEPLQ